TVGADPWASAAVSMNRTEENSFFGVPLLVGAAVVVACGWRRPLVRALGAVVLLSCWLSLGEEITVNGRATGIPGPWAVLEAVPVVQYVVPTRLALIAVPALAALLAIGFEMVRVAIARYSGRGGAAVAVALGAGIFVLLPVVPTPLVVDPRPPVPAFFSTGTWQDWVDDGSVYAVPPPTVDDARALEWQAAARWGFPVVAGYFVGPGPGAERVGQYGATPTALTQWIGSTALNGVAPPLDAAQVAAFRQDLRDGQVDAVVLPEARPDAAVLRDAVSSVLGAPVREGGVYVWDVRGLAGGKG
ncbi:MAG: glycosyl transferase, partial [Ornithinibacter sp.]